jgi:hypothetical protein
MDEAILAEEGSHLTEDRENNRLDLLAYNIRKLFWKVRKLWHEQVYGFEAKFNESYWDKKLSSGLTIWHELARLCLDNDISPAALVCANVPRMIMTGPVTPNFLKSDDSIKYAKQFQQSMHTAIRAKYDMVMSRCLQLCNELAGLHNDKVLLDQLLDYCCKERCYVMAWLFAFEKRNEPAVYRLTKKAIEQWILYRPILKDFLPQKCVAILDFIVKTTTEKN